MVCPYRVAIVACSAAAAMIAMYFYNNCDDDDDDEQTKAQPAEGAPESQESEEDGTWGAATYFGAFVLFAAHVRNVSPVHCWFRQFCSGGGAYVIEDTYPGCLRATLAARYRPRPARC